MIWETWILNKIASQIVLFLVGSEATLALTGGSGGISGDRRTRMGRRAHLPTAGKYGSPGCFVPKLAFLADETGKDFPGV